MFLDLTGVQAAKGASTVLPTGDYNAFIDTAEVKTSKDGQGQYIHTMWKVTDEAHRNRTVFQNYNIKSSSATAENIGKGELKQILELNGKTEFKLQTPADLLGMRACIYVTIRSQDGFKDQNIIKGYKKFTGTTTTTANHQGKSSSTQATVPGL